MLARISSPKISITPWGGMKAAFGGFRSALRGDVEKNGLVVVASGCMI